MKMILSVLSIEDAPGVQNALTNADFAVTKLATTGGFLNSGNITFLTATEDTKIDECLDIIKAHSHSHVRKVPSESEAESKTKEVTVGGAVIFVLDVEQFKKL